MSTKADGVISVGIIGTSWFADMLHLPVLSGIENADVTAICGRNAERANEMAAKYNIRDVFTDYEEMIENAEIQAIVIVTPNDTHFPMVMKALEKGLHVICEKPLAMTVKDATAMYEKAESMGVCHMPHFTYRFLPVFRQAKRLIERDYIGKLYHIDYQFYSGHGIFWPYFWGFDREHSVGALGEMGCHIFDLCRWYGGDIHSVSARLAKHVERTRPDGSTDNMANDSAHVLLEFKSGASGSIVVSTMATLAERFQTHHLTICGANGTLEIDTDSSNGVSLKGSRQGDENFGELTIDEDISDGLDIAETDISNTVGYLQRNPVGHKLFFDSIQSHKPVSPSFYDGLQAQRAIGAALKSDETGCWAEL